MKNHRVTGLVEVQSEDCGILWNHGISWPQTMWSDVKRCEATWDGLQHVKSGMVAIPSDPHQDLSWKMAIWPTARPWSAAPRGPRGPRTSEQKGQGHFEKDIARHYGNITPKIRTKVTKLLGLECLECFEWEFRFRFTVIHQVVSSGNEFSGSQRAGIWHLDLQRSVPRGAQDSTGRHRTAPAPVVLESRICRWHPQEWKWPVRMAGGWILVWGGRGAKVCWHWAHAVGHIILGSGTW
jgi:hypothetical protein